MSTVLNFRKAVEFSFLLTTRQQIQKIHKKFMGDPQPTDVITFAEARKVEAVISLDQARKQASQRHCTLAQETLLLILHALLHAKGFDDRRERAALQMRAQEFRILARVL